MLSDYQPWKVEFKICSLDFMKTCSCFGSHSQMLVYMFSFSKVSCPVGLGLGLQWCFGRQEEAEGNFYDCTLYCNNH